MKKQINIATGKPTMDEDLNYGPVLITKGSHKGQIGYYDDDDEDGLFLFTRGIQYDAAITSWYGGPV